MQSGSGWRFVDGAPKPVKKSERSSGNGSLPVQQPHQPVLELYNAQGTEAAALAFFVEITPGPITFAACSRQGVPFLYYGGGNFSAAGAACSTDASPKPHAHAAAAAGESLLGPTTEEASTDSRKSTFFHVFYSDG